MRLEQRIEHECNRLLCPKGALGYYDTTENRTNSLIFLYRLGLLDEFTFTRISKAIDLIDFENPEVNLSSTILEDAKVKTIMKLEISLPDEKTLKGNVEREYNFLLTHARIFGQADNIFIRAMYLNILFRLQLISYALFFRGMDVLKYMDFSFKEEEEEEEKSEPEEKNPEPKLSEYAKQLIKAGYMVITDEDMAVTDDLPFK